MAGRSCEPVLIKLDRRNFTQQVLKYGYISEQIPKCFSSASLTEYREELLRVATKKSKNGTSPAALSIYKNGLSRRIVSVPHPWDFLATVKYMGERWADISKHAKSENSLSPLHYLHKYGFRHEEVINSENAREALFSKSDFVKGIHECILLSLGYRYQLNVDVSQFYNSIYTHSITWAICGKDDAKRYWLARGSQGAKDLKPSEYDFADALDNLMRHQNNKETNGILTGPFTSRVFSELLMSGVDDLLRDNVTDKFKRYVDDYKFYFKSEAEARAGVLKIERCLNEFKLSLNQQKIDIREYPFDVISPIKERLDSAFANGGVFGLLNEASILHMQNEKGAYKYALKMVRGKSLNQNERELVLSALFNINLVNPKYAKYIVDFVKRNDSELSKERLSNIVNDELRSSLDESLEQEVVNFLYFILELNLDYDAVLIARAIERGNDFARIIALALRKHRLDCARGDDAAFERLERAAEALAAQLANMSMDGEHWLLLYESHYHQLLDDVKISAGETASLFWRMKELGISFFTL